LEILIVGKTLRQTPLALMAVQPSAPVVSSDWQRALPTLRGKQVVLRELRASDAPSLCALLTTEEVSRFMSPPPPTVEGFERFISWTLRQRTAGAYACFAATVRGYDTAVGVFQIHETERGFGTAEWGFAVGSAFWGTGLFQEGAALVFEFAFDTIGVHRMEARAAVLNGRGNRALQKIGAIRECVLRKSFVCKGEYLDQALYAVLAADWRRSKSAVVLNASAQVH
jgi:ribosomal-protein-alanine N-acetyltransferase